MTDPSTKVVVIGGDAAGMSAAAQASRGRISTRIVVFERSSYTSVAAAGLPYVVAGSVHDTTRVVARTPQEHRANGIDVRLDHEVVGIDLEARTVEARSTVEGTSVVEGFDQLVIATGAEPVRPRLPGIDAGGVTGIQTIPDAELIGSIIRERSPRRAVVVGGGYIGVEMAEALLDRGLEVTLVERLPQLMPTLDPDMADLVSAGLGRLGVVVHTGAEVDGFEVGPDGWVRTVSTAAGQFPADLVVMGLGVRPAAFIAAEAGITIGSTGAIATDARMSTDVEGVWAAGDCAESLHRVTGRPTWVALGTHANKHGRVVGLNIGGTHARFPGVIGTAVTRIGELEVGRTGLGEAEAITAGFDAVSATIEGETRADYYPGAAPVSVKVVAERGSGRMLGAQIVGGEGSAKRIDALAVAVWSGMTTEEYSQLDLGYAPPLSPVWDPTLIAARLTGRAVR